MQQQQKHWVKMQKHSEVNKQTHRDRYYGWIQRKGREIDCER